MAQTIINTPYPSEKRVAELLRISPERARQIKELLVDGRTSGTMVTHQSGKASATLISKKSAPGIRMTRCAGRKPSLTPAKTASKPKA